MFLRNGLKHKRLIAGVTSLLLLLPSSIAFAAEPTRQELLNALKVITPKGSEINTVTPFTRPIAPANQNADFRPVTWGDFLNFIVQKFNFDAEVLLKYSNTRKELIMTKTEVQENYKLLIEASKGVKMDVVSGYRLMSAINSLNPYSNFLVQNDLVSLSNREFEVNEKGDMIESFKAKIVGVEGSLVEIKRVGNQSYILSEKFILDTQRPWSLENKIYQISTIGNKITSVQPVHDINRAIIQNYNGIPYIGTQFLVNNPTVKPGDFVEYFEVEDTIHVVENYGSFLGSYVVKSVESTTIDTYEDLTLRRIAKIIDKDGIEIATRNLNRGDLISRFGNYLIANSRESEHNIRYANDMLYIDNVGFKDDNIMVQDGITIKDLEDYDYMNYVSKAKVVWDVLGNPKIVKVPQIEFVVDVREISKDGIVKGISSNGNFEAKLHDNFKSSRIRQGNVYSLIVVDNIIYESDSLDVIYGEVDTLYDTYFHMGRRQYVDDNTLVIVEETNTKGEVSVKETTYKQLLSEYESKIKNGYMDISVYYLERGEVLLMRVEYIPMEGMGGDKYLRRTPLNLYKVSALNIDNGGTVTLSDGTNSVLFTVENRNMFLGIQTGDYVEAYFSSRGNLSNIYPFEFTHTNITTAGLAGYLKMFESTTNVQNVISGSDEETILRAEYTFYRKLGDSAVAVKPEESLAIGHHYLIIVDGNLSKVVVLGGVQ